MKNKIKINYYKMLKCNYPYYDTDNRYNKILTPTVKISDEIPLYQFVYIAKNSLSSNFDLSHIPPRTIH